MSAHLFRIAARMAEVSAAPEDFIARCLVLGLESEGYADLFHLWEDAEDDDDRDGALADLAELLRDEGIAARVDAILAGEIRNVGDPPEGPRTYRDLKTAPRRVISD